MKLYSVQIQKEDVHKTTGDDRRPGSDIGIRHLEEDDFGRECP